MVTNYHELYRTKGQQNKRASEDEKNIDKQRIQVHKRAQRIDD